MKKSMLTLLFVLPIMIHAMDEDISDSSQEEDMINIKDNDGLTALQLAIKIGPDKEQSSIAVILIFAGANLDLTNDEGETPLQTCEKVKDQRPMMLEVLTAGKFLWDTLKGEGLNGQKLERLKIKDACFLLSMRKDSHYESLEFLKDQFKDEYDSINDRDVDQEINQTVNAL